MEELMKALKEQHAALNRQAVGLRKENKNDEAVFCTVRANVYDICATVLGVWVKRGDPGACAALFARFREEWGASLEAAKRQNDAKKQCVEETKLEALQDVTARYEAARGE